MDGELLDVLAGSACVLWLLGLALAVTCGLGRWYLGASVGVPRRFIRMSVRLVQRFYRGVIRVLIVRPLRWLARRWWEALREGAVRLIERFWKW